MVENKEEIVSDDDDDGRSKCKLDSNSIISLIAKMPSSVMFLRPFKLILSICVQRDFITSNMSFVRSGHCSYFNTIILLLKSGFLRQRNL